MEYRYLGRCGFRVPGLCLGTGTFSGRGPLFSQWGSTDVAEARRLVDICIEAGVTSRAGSRVFRYRVAPGVRVKHLRRCGIQLPHHKTLRSPRLRLADPGYGSRRTKSAPARPGRPIVRSSVNP
jgi:hypothetical protein